MIKRTTTTLSAVVCMLMGCASSDSPRHQIEKHLGVSVHGKRVLDQYMFGITEGAPDMPLVRHELLKHDDMRNLTIGLLMMPWTEELDIEMIEANITPDSLKQVLDANLSKSGSTLVRPENITIITVETNATGSIVGTFDWIVPDLLRGRCRFVATGNKLEYLGVLRKNPVGTYDCETLFAREGDILSSQQWIRTEHFAAIEAASDTTRSLSRADQVRKLQELITSGGLNSAHWPIRDESLPIVYSGEREDRDRVVKILEDSDNWKVIMTGRAVDCLFEEPLHKSIEMQIRKTVNKRRHETH